MNSLSFKKMKFTLFLLSVFVVALCGFSFTASAATVDLTGWGWSSNIGWISFSSESDGVPAGSSYGVKLDMASGDLSGYAWSNSIGWISFNLYDVDNECPSIPAEDGASKQARVLNITNGGTREVRGWARAKIGDKGPNNFSTGDWDGCIHLSSGVGGNHRTAVADGTKGVTLTVIDNKDTFVGFAWGGEVVGWLDFAPFLNKFGTPPPPPTCTENCGGGGGGGGCVGVCGGGGPSLPSVTLLANNSQSLAVTTEDPVTLSWIVTDATSCTASMVSGPNPGWSGSKAISGNMSQALGTLAENVYTFRLTCQNSAGQNSFDDVAVRADPPAGPSVVNVTCRAIGPDGNVTPLIFVGTPVTWQASIELVSGQPLPNYNFIWHGSGFSNAGLSGSSPTPVIETARVYTTTGTKEVYIEITGTGAPNSIGSCQAEPATVQVKAKPVFEPF